MVVFLFSACCLGFQPLLNCSSSGRASAVVLCLPVGHARLFPIRLSQSADSLNCSRACAEAQEQFNTKSPLLFFPRSVQLPPDNTTLQGMHRSHGAVPYTAPLVVVPTMSPALKLISLY